MNNSPLPEEEGLPVLPVGRVVVPLSRDLVPLVMPVQQTCYPAHLHEEPDSFVDKVVASPTTSFVCLLTDAGESGERAFLTVADGTTSRSAAAASPSPASQPSPTAAALPQNTPAAAVGSSETGVHAPVDVDPEQVAAAGLRPSSPTAPSSKAVGYLITIPVERFQAPALDSSDCPKPALDTADTLYLHDMAILPEARGCGVAQTLLSLAEGKQQELQLQRMALIAVEGADAFWVKQGFTPVDEAALPREMRDKLKAYGEGAKYMEKRA